MKSLLITMISLILFSCQINTAEPPERRNVLSMVINSNCAKNNIGSFQKLPDEIIAKILLHAIIDKANTSQEKLTIFEALCKTNKYLYILAQKKLYEPAKVEKIKKDVLLSEMNHYEKKINRNNTSEIWNWLIDWNALHLASYNGDIIFIKKILPRLFNLKMFDIINKKISKSKDTSRYLEGYTPFSCLLTHRSIFEKNDKEFPELVKLYIDSNAQTHDDNFYRSQLLIELLYKRFNTAKELLKYYPCKEIAKMYNCFKNDKITSDFIRDNHPCGTCKF